MWDVETGKRLKRFESRRSGGRGLSISRNGRYLVSGGSGNDLSIRVWEVESGKEIQQLKGLANEIVEIVFLPDSRRIISTERDGTLRLWDALAGKEIRRFEKTPTYCFSLHQGLSPDGRRFLTYGGQSDRSMRLWDVETGKQLHCFTGHTAGLTGAVFLPDGKFALSGSLDNTMRLWRLPDPSQAKVEPKPVPAKAVEVFRHRWVADRGRGYPRGVDLSPDGSRLLSSHWGGVRIWDVKANKLLHENLDGWAGRFTPDAKQYVVAGWDVYRLYDTESGKLVRKFGPSTQGNLGFIMCPDGRTVWLSRGEKAMMWDYTTGEEVPPKKGDDPDYDKRFWGDGAIAQFSRRTKIVVDYVLPGGREVMGRQLVEGDALAIYDVSSDKLARKIPVGWSGPVREHYNAAAYGLRFGRRMAVSRPDGTIYVVDLVSGEEVARLSAGNFAPKALAISADDRFVAACASNENSDVVVWRLPDQPAGLPE